jgi:hypothetical protein
MISHFLSDALCLEIPPNLVEHRSVNESAFSTAGARWRAEINQICLDTVLPWLQEDHQAKAKASPNIWEFVNGSAVECDRQRLILIPTSDFDQSELRVPQEWVDIPNWQGDYYWAVQVNMSENCIRIWGYTTHYQLKTQGRYDANDRTYCLNEDQLIRDVNVLWVSQQLQVPETQQAEGAVLAPLPTPQAKSLMERLGNPEVIFPRLAVPFSLWAGLMTHGGWRQQVYERRQGLAPRGSVVEWLQSGIANWAEGWNRTTIATVQGARSLEEGLVRSLTIAGQDYELRIFPQGTATWRFELRTEGTIPSGVTLRLLSEDLQPFEHNEDRAEAVCDRLYVDVVLEQGEGIVWEVTPTPEDYIQEVLYF